MTAAGNLLEQVRQQLDRAALFTDFDGTLAPIVQVPEEAKLLDGADGVIGRLVARAGLFAIVSGRPVSFLEDHVPEGPVLSGLYGLELLRDGERHDHPRAGSWREVISDIEVASRVHGPTGMVVESKGLALTLHYRQHPRLAERVEEWARAQATRSGLTVRPAKMSVELHPPVTTDKGTVVLGLAADHDPVVYIGDDHGDLPAFDALARLAARGRTALRVAVAGPDTPPEIIESADMVVDGVAASVALLDGLTGQGSSAT